MKVFGWYVVRLITLAPATGSALVNGSFYYDRMIAGGAGALSAAALAFVLFSGDMVKGEAFRQEKWVAASLLVAFSMVATLGMVAGSALKMGDAQEKADGRLALIDQRLSQIEEARSVDDLTVEYVDAVRKAWAEGSSVDIAPPFSAYAQKPEAGSRGKCGKRCRVWEGAAGEALSAMAQARAREDLERERAGLTGDALATDALVMALREATGITLVLASAIVGFVIAVAVEVSTVMPQTLTPPKPVIRREEAEAEPKPAPLKVAKRAEVFAWLDAGKTQTETARLTGVPQPTISKWNADRRNLKVVSRK